MSGALLRRWLCACALAASLPEHGDAPFSSEQTKTQVTQKEERPVVRVTTRLVEVSVIVLDKHGQPVAGLGRDDFALFDEGEQQPIEEFFVETKRGEVRPMEALPPNTFSNRAPPSAGTLPSVTVILFDGLNTRLSDQQFARERILKFLRQLQPEDRVALYLLGERLYVLHEFTNDTKKLLAALDRYRGGHSQSFETTAIDKSTIGSEEIDSFLFESSRRISEAFTKNRLRRTLYAIEAIAQHLAMIPGRKNLIWVSGGFPLSIGFEMRPPGDTSFRDQQTFTGELERAARAINQANVAIYPVDARGLFPDPMDEDELRATQPYFASGRQTSRSPDKWNPKQTSERSSSGGGERISEQPGKAGSGKSPAPPTAPNRGLRELEATHETMRLIADRTGGRAFYNTNEIEGAIRAAIEESRGTYLLGFYPKHNRWNGEFREIRVKVNRGGLQVRHRRGYLAVGATDAAPEQIDSAFRDLIASPFDASAIALTAQVSPLPGRSGAAQVDLRVEPRDVRLNREDNLWKGILELRFVQLDRRGEVLWSEERKVDLNLQPETYERALKEGLRFSKRLPFKPGSDQIRVVVRDRLSGALGSIRIPEAAMSSQPGAKAPQANTPMEQH